MWKKKKTDLTIKKDDVETKYENNKYRFKYLVHLVDLW